MTPPAILVFSPSSMMIRRRTVTWRITRRLLSCLRYYLVVLLRINRLLRRFINLVINVVYNIVTDNSVWRRRWRFLRKSSTLQTVIRDLPNRTLSLHYSITCAVPLRLFLFVASAVLSDLGSNVGNVILLRDVSIALMFHYVILS